MTDVLGKWRPVAMSPPRPRLDPGVIRVRPPRQTAARRPWQLSDMLLDLAEAHSEFAQILRQSSQIVPQRVVFAHLALPELTRAPYDLLKPTDTTL